MKAVRQDVVSRGTRLSCVLLLLNPYLGIVGCGTSDVASVPIPSSNRVPLTPDHPISIALRGTAFAAPEALEIDPVRRTFRLAYSDPTKSVGGTVVPSASGTTIADFSFSASGRTTTMKFDARTKQVRSIETSDGYTWRPASPPARRGAPIQATSSNPFLAANGELLSLERQAKDGASLSVPGFFFAFVAATWLYCAAVCPVFVLILGVVIPPILAALPPIPGLSPTDPDGDGVPAVSDNCPDAANPGQQDADGDGIGDACDSSPSGPPPPSPAPPVAQNDAFTTPEDIPLSANVLADNGSGADSDSNNDPLSVSLAAGPTHGTLILAASGAFTYTPNPSFVGGDSFSYNLSDGQGGSSSALASIAVTPVNDRPIAAEDAFETNLGASLTGSLFSNNGAGPDADADDDTFQVCAINGLAPAVGVTMLMDFGSLTVQPDGTLNYSAATNPSMGKHGPFVETFTYTICDPAGAKGSAIARINVNRPPAARDDHFIATTQPATEAGNLFGDNDFGEDEDPDADPLWVTEVNGSAVNVGRPLSLPRGVLTVRPDGTFTYEHGLIPARGEAIPPLEPFEYTVSDGKGGRDNATVVLIFLGPC